MKRVVKLSIIPLLLLTCCASKRDPMENYEVEIWAASSPNGETIENAISIIEETGEYKISYSNKGPDSNLLENLKHASGVSNGPDIIIVSAAEYLSNEDEAYSSSEIIENNVFRYIDYALPLDDEMKESAQTKYGNHFCSFATKDDKMIGFPLSSYDFLGSNKNLEPVIPSRGYSFALIQKEKIDRFIKLPLHDYLKKFVLTFSEQFLNSNI